MVTLVLFHPLGEDQKSMMHCLQNRIVGISELVVRPKSPRQRSELANSSFCWHENVLEQGFQALFCIMAHSQNYDIRMADYNQPLPGSLKA